MGVLRLIGLIVRFLAGRARSASKAASAFTPPPLPPAFQSLSDFAARPGALVADVITAPRGRTRRLLSRLPLRYRLALAVPAAGIVAAGGVLSAMMVYYTVAFPHPLSMRSKERAPVIRILARDGSVLAERGAAADYMPLDLLPRHVQAAVVATEDRRFYEHFGLDPTGLVRAAFANLRAGRVAQGGSTLTQQLAKNLFLTPERTMARKVEELALALWLELRLTKADILELYLNRVYFGAGAYGIEAASQRYFDKSARELTVAEAALIAGLLKAPSKYSPLASPGAARARSRVVLAKMREAGAISAADEARALAERIVFNESRTARETSGLDYAVDFVLERLPPLLGGGHAELVVETTLDPDLQKKANEIVGKALAKQGVALGASQAAVVVLDNDGGIRALVGGRDYAESQFNRAVKARRQPGSAFKPMVYLAALESGMKPDSVTFDLPLTIDGWAPRNDNGQYIGEVSLRQALAKSINTVAVKLNQDVGRGRTIDVARRLGIKSELREGPALALGTSEVGLMELTGAYSVFANGGMAVEPHAIRRVRLSSGRVLFARDLPRTTQVVDLAHVGEMNDMLNAALMTGTGRRAAIANHPAAGKTGTTQDFRDAWFIGYTSHLTAGVWIGNDNSKPMLRAVGGGLPAEIWRQLMQAAHENKAPLALPGTVRKLDAEVSAPAAPEAIQATGEARKVAEPQAAVSIPPRAAAAPAPAALPWTKTPPAPFASAAAPQSPVRRVPVVPPDDAHPVNRIDDDFIARALDQVPDQTGTQMAQDEAAPVQRPPGMMSLGGWFR